MTKAPQAFSQAPAASPPAPASGPRPAPACSAGRSGSSLPLLDRRPSSVPHAQRWPNPLHPAFCESEVGTHVRTAQLPSPFPAPRPTTPARGGSAEPRPGERVTRDRRGRPRARPGSGVRGSDAGPSSCPFQLTHRSQVRTGCELLRRAAGSRTHLKLWPQEH